MKTNRITGRGIPVALISFIRPGCALLASLLLAFGCTKDPEARPSGDPADNQKVSFTLVPSATSEITVRSVEGANESIIKDVWVIQLNEAGTAQLTAQYLSPAAGGTTVDVSLQPVNSRVYFIVNTHNKSLYNANHKTSAAVEAVTKTVSSEGNISTADGVPMSGLWTGTPSGSALHSVSLMRAVSKVTLNLRSDLPPGDHFAITGVQVKQVPNTLQYYRDPATLSTYPYPSGGVFDYPIDPQSGELTSTVRTLNWILPENARGTGTATATYQKTAATAPSGQGNFCTYIEVQGRYSWATAGTIRSVYRIFLGADNLRDYNLLRNRNYTVNVVIRSNTSLDLRIVYIDLGYTDNNDHAFWLNLTDTAPIYQGYEDRGRDEAPINPMKDDTWKYYWRPYNFSEHCPPGWRPLTHGEMALLYIYKEAYASENAPKGWYWTDGMSSDWIENRDSGGPLYTVWRPMRMEFNMYDGTMQLGHNKSLRMRCGR